MNGLVLSIEEFERLPNKQRLSCLYRNQVEQMIIMKGYKFYYKVTSIVGGFILAGMLILFKMHLGA
jgi:hypothetical protein